MSSVWTTRADEAPCPVPHHFPSLQTARVHDADHSLGSGFANIKRDTDCGIVAVPNTHCSNNLISRHSGGEAQLFKTSKILRIGQIAANLQCFPCEGVDLQELAVTTKTAQIH